ncbi:MAG: hypothetical protein A3E37_05615 [Candidatus Andersenbacteria bacterium RIFCSPHIGHO2_12_FULL_46_9]|nr:MAG: hypothetical protein A3B76_03655 [Candidatus Andersenbacteria bacterium RIFCSPHIGHO2_02_FULL_46_16]OGY37053.1 MAG: hypothetical protein A3I08_02835 [Candidatus Andersenbacteria bacterium RIFCSPLOWO2_02_FULL_46_11]OGY37831.1 MAG: hypothetical protein A3E37_05615 [Candidatus Andersenbacteria bacterium RIFCSPHIGHO2_12_FULL_46_9]
MDIPENQAAFRQQLISQLTSAGANTVFINPWSDGNANYHSSLAPISPFGQQQWLEKFITEAHAAHLQVYAWFVVGKDNFPAQQHPDWYARTINNEPYNQTDEPGINLPFASLAHPDFIKYHLQVINEVNQLPLDGWVISEPLIGWGDKDDSFYTDFSDPAIFIYQQAGIHQPTQLIKNLNLSGQSSDLELYDRLVNARAGIVTNFVAQTMQQVRRHANRPIIITIFTEPDARGNLLSSSAIKEWLGTDIAALSSLQPNIIEIQSLFLDFEHPQPPNWTASMVRQFKQQLKSDIPVAVSVQGFASEDPLPPAQFAAAITAATQEFPAGVSFYAYHTLTPQHWQRLSSLWKTK